ncbi:predicted protein [Chaetomium globosum CBS 148.51]|uniref:Uncharacterized protein n=1 Tax=Chaetomium globosum (strain ATCC 6205 / CBS 148.51 / DSM 1962 / NBRC 6347 / NRRL 1970) TaxID=306901 RepID=Q2GRC4_CHAGB|nr:uncharacterized protein CHGG_09480 [Chaetomium globosum CBS 148.51]EAQ85466.1 predicted protein [Chaetomium globosum CBS 148.51]
MVNNTRFKSGATKVATMGLYTILDVIVRCRPHHEIPDSDADGLSLRADSNSQATVIIIVNKDR